MDSEGGPKAIGVKIASPLGMPPKFTEAKIQKERLMKAMKESEGRKAFLQFADLLKSQIRSGKSNEIPITDWIERKRIRVVLNDLLH